MLKFQPVAEKTAKNFRGLLFFAALVYGLRMSVAAYPYIFITVWCIFCQSQYKAACSCCNCVSIRSSTTALSCDSGDMQCAHFSVQVRSSTAAFSFYHIQKLLTVGMTYVLCKNDLLSVVLLHEGGCLLNVIWTCHCLYFGNSWKVENVSDNM